MDNKKYYILSIVGVILFIGGFSVGIYLSGNHTENEVSRVEGVAECEEGEKEHPANLLEGSVESIEDDEVVLAVTAPEEIKGEMITVIAGENVATEILTLKFSGQGGVLTDRESSEGSYNDLEVGSEVLINVGVEVFELLENDEEIKAQSITIIESINL